MHKLLCYFTSVLCFLPLNADDCKRGISLLKSKQYAEASLYFERAITQHDDSPEAHYGKLFCDIALAHHAALEIDFQNLYRIQTQKCRCNPRVATAPSTPSEQTTAYSCRQNIRKLSNELRRLMEQLVRESVPGIFQKIKTLRQLYPYIDTLERYGMDCCEAGEPGKCCVEPLVQQFKLWNSEGLPQDINEE